MTAAFEKLQRRLEIHNGEPGRKSPSADAKDEAKANQFELSASPMRLFRMVTPTPMTLEATSFGYREDTVTLSSGEYVEKRKRGWFQIVESELEGYLHHVWLRERDVETQEITKRYFWLFVSSGLEQVLGTELVMLVSRREDQPTSAFPSDPIYLFHQLYNGRQKPIPGSLVRLAEPIFSRPDFRTLMYGIRNLPLRNLRLLDVPLDGFGLTDSELPRNTLQITVLTDVEAEIAAVRSEFTR